MEFKHLSSGEFEELTYDLLAALGFVNLSWRRGSGSGGASADQGRDIVAQELRKTVDDTKDLETWFVQCKHYVHGVPPEKLQGALSWATAERPAVLLFVVSNFLSNPAKMYLEEYERNNRPPFRLRLWERKDLERLLSSHPSLLRKYQLNPMDPTLTAHPAHLQYMLNPRLNTLDYFLGELDGFDPTMRDDVFSSAFYSIINPRYRRPKHQREKIAELLLDPVDYPAFCSKCRELAKRALSDHFLVHAIVSDALKLAWLFSDATKVEEATDRHREMIGHFEEQLKTETDRDAIEAARGLIAFSQEMIDSADQRRQKWSEHYRVLCEVLLPRLAMEQLDLGLTQNEITESGLLSPSSES